MTVPIDVGYNARQCTVMLLDGAGRFLGSGFFVELRIVVTCAHVVEKAGDELRVRWAGRTWPARVLVREPPERVSLAGEYPYPDVAFVGVEILDNPIGYVVGPHIGDDVKDLVVYGFSQFTPAPDPVPDSVLVGVLGDAGAYKKVDARHIVPGMSGAPVTDDGGYIRGMLKSGRMRLGDSGSVIHGNVILALFAEYRTVLGGHMRTRPPLARPAPGSLLHRVLVAQREVAKDYPYRLAQLSRRTAPPLSTIYVEQRTEARAAPPTQLHADTSGSVVISPTEMLRRHRNALVIGGPGGGKSTLLQQLVAECAGWWLRTGPAAPSDEPALGRVAAIQAAATDLLDDRPWFESVALSVSRDLRGYLDVAVPPDLLQRPPAPGAEWLIMIDGLDEVIDAHQRERLAAMLGHRVAEYGAQARFVVTSRPLAEREFGFLRSRLADAGSGERLGEYTLRPFDRPAVETFATNWFRPRTGERSQIDPRDFLDGIDRSGLGVLVQVPLLATITAVVYEEGPSGPLPMDRTGLYEVFVTVLLTQRNQRLGSRQLFVGQLAQQGRAAEEFGELLFDNRLDCLTYLAQRQIGGDRRPLMELAQEWVRALGRQPPLGVTAEHVRDLLLSTGLLITYGEGLGFVHQSFAEYLASLGIIDEFDSAKWLDSVRTKGSDSWSMFALAGWVRAGNDPIPLVGSLLATGSRREYPGLPEVAALLEDGGALVEGAGPAVVTMTERAVRRMGRPTEAAVPTLSRVMGALHHRSLSGEALIRLATDTRLHLMKRIEAARVLVTSRTPEDRRTGLATAVNLAYTARMSDEDRLWAQRTLAEVGGPDERPHAVQRMVQTVETSSNEAVRVRALALLAELNELPAAAAALVRRSLEVRHSLSERLAALDALRVLVGGTDPVERWMPAGEHAGSFAVRSLAWSGVAAPVSPGRSDQLDRYTEALSWALLNVATLDASAVEALVHQVMRDRTLGWARRMFIVRALHKDMPRQARAATWVLVEDRSETPANRIISASLFAESSERWRVRALIQGWLDDARQSAPVRRAALAHLADSEGPAFVAAVAADAHYPAYLRVAAALRHGRDPALAADARRLLSLVGRDVGWAPWRRVPILSARLALRLSMSLGPLTQRLSSALDRLVRVERKPSSRR